MKCRLTGKDAKFLGRSNYDNGLDVATENYIQAWELEMMDR